MKTNFECNHFKGEKVVWLGTSVPYGSNTYNGESYASLAAKKLGFQIIPAVVPGEAIHAKMEDGQLQPLDYGSTVLSKAEYAQSGRIQIQDKPLAWEPGSEANEEHPGTGYNNYYRTWENIFTVENRDAYLYVFDVAPNNTDFSDRDWEAFDTENWKYKDGSNFAEHRTTFLGALLFLMDKMYETNPDARMVLLLGSPFAYQEASVAFEKLKRVWNIPVIDAWSKVNTSPKSMHKIKSKNGSDNHPSDFGHQVLGNIIANELLLIS